MYVMHVGLRRDPELQSQPAYRQPLLLASLEWDLAWFRGLGCSEELGRLDDVRKQRKKNDDLMLLYYRGF